MQYIKSVAQAFTNHVKQKKIILLKDNIQIYFEPEPRNPKINKLSQQLRINFDKSATKAAILGVDRIFSEVLIEVYQSAIKDKQYIGADIWSFFKNKVDDYCIRPNHRNILFIITDGYMFHEDSRFKDGNRSSYLTSSTIKALKINSINFREIIRKNNYGYIKAHHNLSELEVVLLGINPVKGNPFEGDIIKTYWENWLKEMKVKKYMIKFSDLPSSIDPILKRYIAQ